MAMSGADGYYGPATVNPSVGYADKQTIARDELASALKRFEERRMVRTSELDAARQHLQFLERECETLGETCEAISNIIRRSEELNVPVGPRNY